ncbi:MAG TPA: response regulator [Candidatus Angelobacter sp.]|nr:response regulator [Candidatus Angelobacter sp.]
MGPLAEVILLVEDESSDAHLLQRAFQKAQVPARIIRVANGDEAIAYLTGREPWNRRQHPLPGIIMMDIKLPRRSGFEVLEWLRDQEALRRIPVVMLSSSPLPHDVNRAYDLGANSYLTKPQDPEKFVRLACAFRDYWLCTNVDPAV